MLNVNREFAPVVSAYMQSSARHRFILGPFGSGKSVGSQTDIPRRAAMQAPSTIDGMRKTRFAVVRQTRPQLRSTTMKTWFDQFPNGSLGNYHGLTNTYHIKQNDILCEVVFLPLDTDDDVKNLLSYELTGVYLNEFRDIPRAIVEALDGRIGRYPRMEEGGPTFVGIWGDSNMPEIGSYWHSMLTKRNPDEPAEPKNNKWEVFIQPPAMLRRSGDEYVVNPSAENLRFLPPDYYPNLIENKTADYIRTYVMCEYGRSRGGKPVHPMFDSGAHVSKTALIPDKKNLLLVSADFGLTPAICLMQQNAFGQVLVLDAISTFGMGLERAIEEKLLPLMRRKYDGFDVFVTGDPSGSTGSQSDETSCADVFRRYKNKGLGKIKFAYSNAPVHRMGALDYFLSRNGDGGRKMFLVDPGAEPLIAALSGGYMFKLFKDGRPTVEVDKTNPHSHIGEACEYGCMYFERGGRRKAENLEKSWDELMHAQQHEVNHYVTPR